MAANKFATMLHRNTNKITLILVYAFLEWILILLLLLNSLFSYLIIKFADYFGLTRPCLWCSRLDHLFHSGYHYTQLVCQDHAAEISNLGFCSHHHKLVQFQQLCQGCSSSLPPDSGICHTHLTCSCCALPLERKFNSLSPDGDWTTKEGDRDFAAVDGSRSDALVDREEDEEEFGQFKASHGGKVFESGEGEEESTHSLSPSPSPSPESRVRELLADEHEKLVMVMEIQNQSQDMDQMMLAVDDDFRKDDSVVISARHLDFFIGGDACNLIPVEWVSSTGEEHQKPLSSMEDDNGGYQDVIMDFYSSPKPHTDPRSEKVFPIHESDEEENIDKVSKAVQVNSTEEGGGQVAAASTAHTQNVLEAVANDSTKEGDERSPAAEIADNEINLATAEGDSTKEEYEPVSTAEVADVPENGNGLREVTAQGDEAASPTGDDTQNVLEASDFTTEGDEQSAATEIADNEISLGTAEGDSIKEGYEPVSTAEVADVLENGNGLREILAQGDEPMRDEVNQVEEGYLLQNDEIDAEVSIGTEIPDHELVEDIHNEEIVHSDEDVVQVEEVSLEFRPLCLETNEEVATSHLPSTSEEVNENEDDTFPETPTSIDSLHQLHSKLLLLEKRDSGTWEESLDGSVASDIEGGEGPLTTEVLKSALKAERKALHALYTELEEERSASAVAASQTMAMINRLQEEKAAMQMEALQYQRMMEEQAEYDQEALQLLNDLMVKREREKQELEKELEVYRSKVEEYEAKEKMGMLLRSSNKGKNSSACCSNVEDEDFEGLSDDLNDEGKDEDHFNNSTPTNAISYLEDSLANFEEERESILNQLKVLEEKLLAEDVDHCNNENGSGHANGEVSGTDQKGHYKMNGKHHIRGRFTGPKAKTLLPLFNAIGEESEHGIQNGNKQDYDGDLLQKTPADVGFEDEELDVEEEMDQLQERLQVLETDREFLKHCISSLRKGDKGLPILQEILQHLRDLRSIEVSGGHEESITDGMIE